MSEPIHKVVGGRGPPNQPHRQTEPILMVVGKWSSLYESLATSFPHQFEKKNHTPLSKVVTVAAKDQNFFADSWSQWKNLFRHQGSFLSFQMAKIWPFHFPFHHSIPVEHSTDSILPFCWGSRFHTQISQPLYSHTIAGALGGLWFQPVFTSHISFMLSQYTGFCKLVVSLQMQNRKASDKINVDRSLPNYSNL